MTSVEIMVNEHKQILRMVQVVRKACYAIMKGEEINYNDFEQMMDFVKNYADVHHHGKEEKFMFKKMQENLGKIGENLITHGMLVEHDLGRLHMRELRSALERVQSGDEESKLDVIANAISYTHLIERHIKKEDELVYPFGEKNLSEPIMKEINDLTDEFEAKAKEDGIQEKYMTLLKKLEEKYL